MSGPAATPTPADPASDRARYFARFLDALRDRPGERCLVLERGGAREALSFREMGARIAARAATLHAAGLGPGQVLLIFSDTRVDLHVTFFAAQFLGAVPAIMPPPNAKQDEAHWRDSHRALVRHIGPGLLCGVGPALDALGDTGVPAISFAALGAREVVADGAVPEVAAGDDGPALLQHSSGTTGLKKGVMLGYGALVRQADSYGAALALRPDDVVATWLPLYHDMGLIACTVLPFIAAMPVVGVDPFEWLTDPLLILRLAERERATLAWLPNFAFEHLANAARRLRNTRLDLGTLRAVVNCSEVCRPASMDRFAAAYAAHGLDSAAPATCYALAENVFAATQSRPGVPPKRLVLDRAALDAGRLVAVEAGAPASVALVSSGAPVDGCRIRFRPAEGYAGEVGEILLSSPCLFDGYLGSPTLTAERLEDGWLRTRDLGFLHEGEVFVLGRLDDIVIYRGRNLVAPDLEAALSDVAAVKPGRAVVFPIPDERVGSDQIVVLYEPSEPLDAAAAAEAERAVRALLGERFAVNPVHVGCVEPGSLRKTTSGKVSRVLNRAAFLADQDGTTP
ncbi:AMP-binding protein [Roseomonas elaeocarpi]|uniref:AMP-binding protein n=1 Tax=Roseomonas elaeocarpi TaxID=907779 RepID=A0ABV6JVJ7_9PROT